MRKRVYIAGPITKGDLAANVNQATLAFGQLIARGFAPFCPHWSVYSANPAMPHPSDPLRSVYTVGTAAGLPGVSYSDWIAESLAWVEPADAVLRLPGESSGADAEVAHARLRGIPIYHSVEEIPA